MRLSPPIMHRNFVGQQPPFSGPQSNSRCLNPASKISILVRKRKHEVEFVGNSSWDDVTTDVGSHSTDFTALILPSTTVQPTYDQLWLDGALSHSHR